MAQKERWASRVGLVLAMAGNAVGLGNFLRFPAQAAANGGGAFLIPYFVALLVVGLPLIWVEWAMGRFGGQHGHHSAPGVFQAHSRNPIWKYLGVMGLWSCLVIASFYLYIETWCMAYAGFSAVGGFQGMDKAGVAGFFGSLTGERDNQILAFSPWGMGLFVLCIALNIFILSRGLAKGIELVSKIGMPLLIFFAAILAVRGLFISPETDPAAKESAFVGLNYVWEPKFTSLADPAVWLAAAGQIFFTLSIGMGSIHCYASYLREKDDVALTGATAAWTNEFCEVILGGTILIPIGVAYLGLQGVRENSSFALGFLVFPTLFNNWGWLAAPAGFMWFGLLFFAAITSSLAMGQPLMAFMQQEFHFSREKSALALGAMLLPLALPVALLHSDSFNGEFDYWAGTVMLVVFAMTEAVLFAWIFGIGRGWDEINKGGEIRVPGVFFFVIKYVTPVFLLLILIGFFFKPVGKVEVLDPETQTTKVEERSWSAYFDAIAGRGPWPKQWEWAGDGMVGKLLHLDLDRRVAAVQSNAELSEEKKAETLSFLEQLKTVRNIDRLVMVGVYVFLCVLVWVAWTRRTAEGRV